METEKLVRPIQVSYDCDKCGRGEMKCIGGTSGGNIPRFYHRCNICKVEVELAQKYPYIKYEEVIEENYDIYS